MVKINEIKGDLFSSKSSLVHCVSECLEMGKGIAVKFRDQFKQVPELRSQNKKAGQVAYILHTDGRYIFYMITKVKYYQKPEYINVYESLVELRDLCLQHKINIISMPKIGCGLDKLEWSIIKKYIENVFKDTNMIINIYVL